MQQDKQFLANKRFSEIIADGLYLFGKNYLILIIPFAFFIIVSILTKALILTDINWNIISFEISQSDLLNKYNTDPFSLSAGEYQIMIQYSMLTFVVSMIDNIIGALFTVISMCVVSNYLYKKYMRINTDFTTDFKKTFNLKLIIVLLIVSIGVPVGFSLLWIPGMIIFGFFIFLVFTFNLEGIERPVREARLIAKGSFLKIIAIFLVCGIIDFIIDLIYPIILAYTLPINSTIINSWYAPVSRNYGMIFLYDLVYEIPSIALAPLFICLLTSLFSSSKAKKEIGYPYTRGTYPVREPYRQPYPPPVESPYRQPYPPPIESPYRTAEPYKPAPAQDKTGMYCPFCGYYISTPRKFCQNCGESLEFK